MIRTALATTAAFALMTGLAFAQAKTDGGTMRSPASPTSGNSGTSLSTGQTQPMQPGSYSTMAGTPGLDSASGSATGGPTPPNGAADTGQSAATTASGTASTMPGSMGSGSMSSGSMGSGSMSSGSMGGSTMASGTGMTSNAPAGDAPPSYPYCTHKGQDRCKQRHAM